MNKENHFNTSSNNIKIYYDEHKEIQMKRIKKYYKSIENKSFIELIYKNKYTGCYTYIEIPIHKYIPDKYLNVPFRKYKYKNGIRVPIE